MSAIWVHEVCGNAPVHPETLICMKCQTPVFLEECNKWQVSDEWVSNHPAASIYLVDVSGMRDKANEDKTDR